MLPPPSQLEATTTAALARNISSGAGDNMIIDDVLPASTGAGRTGARSALAEIGTHTLAELQVIATNLVQDDGCTPAKRKTRRPKSSRNNKQKRADRMEGAIARRGEEEQERLHFTPTEVIKLAEA